MNNQNVKIYTVYIHINKINNKKYVGFTSQNPPEKRWGKNGNGYERDHQRLMYDAIQKYGWDNFDHIILHTVSTEQEAKVKEAYYINLYNTTNKDYGYNTYFYNDNMKITIPSDKRIGENNPFYGKHHSKETKQLLSKINSDGRNAGENNGMFGRNHTEEAKQLMSQKHWDCSGENNPLYGVRKFGEENPAAKLTSQKAFEIFISSKSKKELIEEYKVSEVAINRARLRYKWWEFVWVLFQQYGTEINPFMNKEDMLKVTDTINNEIYEYYFPL